MSAIAPAGTAPGSAGGRSFLLERVQPALSGLMDGSLSTLAPIFAVALATHRPLTAFFTGAATALGAGVSMAFSEGLSDTGDLTGRGSPVLRGAITGGGTFAGGIFHTLPFLIPGYGAAIGAAIAVVGSRTARPGLAAAQVLPHQLRPVVPGDHRRRSDHRRAQRRARRRRQRLTPWRRRLGQRFACGWHDLLGEQAGLPFPVAGRPEYERVHL